VSNWFDYPTAPSGIDSAPSPWPETGDGSEAYPVLPICITIDTSGSMAATGALNAVNACLPRLRTFLRNEPTAGEMARIGLVTFNTSAREVLPLCDVDQVSMPTLTAEGTTNYAAAFRETRAFFERHIPRLGRGVRYYAPIVFFITDGEPSDCREAWMVEAQALKTAGKYRSNVVCFGMGDANPEALREIGITFISKSQDPVESTERVFRELLGSIKTTSASVRDAVESGGSGRLQFGSDIATAFTPYLPLDLNINP
jgi:uncharacterized protein YegL